jgi:hypothetical protein
MPPSYFIELLKPILVVLLPIRLEFFLFFQVFQSDLNFLSHLIHLGIFLPVLEVQPVAGRIQSFRWFLFVGRLGE